MIKNKYLSSIFMIMAGPLLIVLGLFADSIGIGQGGRNLGPSQQIMIAVGIGMIIIGVFSRKFSFVITISLIIMVPLLLLLDNALYWGSARLPENIIFRMTGDAKTKYAIANWKETSMEYDGNIYFRKSNDIIKKEGFEVFYDEFGYRNPPGYISQSKSLDIILLGDSFTEGSTQMSVADNLRIFLDPLKVYSLGVGGQCIPHWQLQFRRYVNSPYFKSTPKIVVLNFYSGNDALHTIRYKPTVPGFIANPPRKPAKPRRNFSFFGEFLSIVRFALYNQLDSNAQEEPLPEDISNPVFVKALSDVVDQIRKVNTNAIILLSYISTPAAIYGPDIERCLKATKKAFSLDDYSQLCKFSANRQIDNSKALHKVAQQLNIYYMDPTPVLRHYAKNELLHPANDLHFNDKAYRIYSKEIAKRIKSLTYSSNTLSQGKKDRLLNH